MKTGFIFKNRHSSEFDVVFKTKSRPVFPEVKCFMLDTPLTDGSYDFTDVNSDGREHYNDRAFEIIMQITGDSLTELEIKCMNISKWLTGSGELIFDSNQPVAWRGRFVSEVAFAPERKGKSAVLSAIFKANPIGTATFNTADGIRLSDGIRLGSTIPFNMTECFEYRLEYGLNNITVNNIGDFYIRPQFIFSEAENVTLSYKDRSIIIEDLNGDLIIDTEKYLITNSLGANLMPNMQGEFFELPSGKSYLTVYVDRECDMKVRYSPKTIYSFDFSQTEWGIADA